MGARRRGHLPLAALLAIVVHRGCVAAVDSALRTGAPEGDADARESQELAPYPTPPPGEFTPGILSQAMRHIDRSEGGVQRLLDDVNFMLQTSRSIAPRLLVAGLLLYPQMSALWRRIASTLRPWMKRFIPIDLYDQIVIPLDQEALLRLWLHVVHAIGGVHFLLSEATVRVFEVLLGYRMEHVPDLVYDRGPAGPPALLRRVRAANLGAR